VLSPTDLVDEVLRAVARGERLLQWFGAPAAWGGATIYAVLADDRASELRALSSTPCSAYPALTPRCTQALPFEREIAEQCGIVAEPPADADPTWWRKPLRFESSEARPTIPGETNFFRVEGEEIHEVAVGPVHAGVIEPGHFRFQCRGEDVLHLEIQLGYQHRGVERLLIGASPVKRAVLAESIAGDTAIGHALAHAQTVEALAGVGVPARAHAIAAIALELERVANHVGDLGALGNDVGFLPTTAHFGRWRGEFLNLLMELSGNRFGRGLVRPGGLLFDLDDTSQRAWTLRLATAESALTRVADMLFENAGVMARLDGCGVVPPAICEELAMVGPAARACGSSRDARCDHPTGTYRFHYVPVSRAHEGDVHARAMVRWLEAQRSLELVQELLAELPAGGVRVELPPLRPSRLAIGVIEGWRGEIVHAAITDESGAVERYKVTDPSVHNWMGLAMALRNEAISDFPLNNKSFNLSYAGHDL
jgi:Ni,Fe-hydrogenase III large subunit